jgi:hypothetical protein
VYSIVQYSTVLYSPPLPPFARNLKLIVHWEETATGVLTVSGGEAEVMKILDCLTIQPHSLSALPHSVLCSISMHL